MWRNSLPLSAVKRSGFRLGSMRRFGAQWITEVHMILDSLDGFLTYGLTGLIGSLKEGEKSLPILKLRRYGEKQASSMIEVHDLNIIRLACYILPLNLVSIIVSRETSLGGRWRFLPVKRHVSVTIGML